MPALSNGYSRDKIVKSYLQDKSIKHSYNYGVHVFKSLDDNHLSFSAATGGDLKRTYSDLLNELFETNTNASLGNVTKSGFDSMIPIISPTKVTQVALPNITHLTDDITVGSRKYGVLNGSTQSVQFSIEVTEDEDGSVYSAIELMQASQINPYNSVPWPQSIINGLTVEIVNFRDSNVNTLFYNNDEVLWKMSLEDCIMTGYNSGGLTSSGDKLTYTIEFKAHYYSTEFS